MPPDTAPSTRAVDPFDLQRFLDAQEHDYERALAEIRNGRKKSHWMWHIFPQFAGLGTRPTAVRYAIHSLEEAAAYLAHAVLGARLVECATAVTALPGRSVAAVFAYPDDLKLRSCATLFSRVAAPGSVFDHVLDKYFKGRADERTLELIAQAAARSDSAS